MTVQRQEEALWPVRLQPGDRVRIVSPASTPCEEGVGRCVHIFETWGLRVELGQHVFSRFGYLAGTDEERLADLNDALRDEGVRAVFASRGGKGSYRIANRLDFAAAARNPKFVVGFSDVTAIHLALYNVCRLVGIHGPLSSWSSEIIGPESVKALRLALMTDDAIVVHADPSESTFSLTTHGRAVGRLIGGNLDTLAICAGWALPRLEGCILLIEAVEQGFGHVDRQLTMLANAGHLRGLQGVAVGQFTKFGTHESGWTIIDVLRHHLCLYGVPILGGLPIGHGTNPRTLPIGATVVLDADVATLQVVSGKKLESDLLPETVAS